MTFECLDCKAIDGGYCEDCATHNDELRALIDEWREITLDEVDYKSPKTVVNNRADELEALLQE